MHHWAYFLSPDTVTSSNLADQFSVESKAFGPSVHVDWFRNPVPTPDAFEEGNMANISPTIKVDISVTPGIT